MVLQIKCCKEKSDSKIKTVKRLPTPRVDAKYVSENNLERANFMTYSVIQLLYKRLSYF